MNFDEVINTIEKGVAEWVDVLSQLDLQIISTRRNGQDRTIKQIVGHMVDSASNNTHRIIHLQYQPNPFKFPCYASKGNNDRWIAIQNYQNEDWNQLIQLWKFTHLHYIHVVKFIHPDKHHNQWDSGDGLVPLRDMVNDFPRHFNLHLNEIRELIDQN
nr:hypothetical protein [uncultured Carboxylicivirga sp.]